MFGTPQVRGVLSLRRVATDEALQFTLAEHRREIAVERHVVAHKHSVSAARDRADD